MIKSLKFRRIDETYPISSKQTTCAFPLILSLTDNFIFFLTNGFIFHLTNSFIFRLSDGLEFPKPSPLENGIKIPPLK